MLAISQLTQQWRTRGLAGFPGQQVPSPPSATPLPAVAKLILVYPMLDDWTDEGFVLAGSLREPYMAGWSPRMNRIAWNAYLGRSDKEEVAIAVSPYAFTARETDLAGLPSTFLDVDGLDLFRDECISFVTRLAEAEVETEFHLYPGVTHGWDTFTLAIAVTKAVMENRRRACAPSIVGKNGECGVGF
ncbi:hypothetical protein GQ53DRAFT_861567 [Thozetella sp. PMI_491]|nr:hypothetical protein GQ53DRAFT_861567 [Thozetella sp. PMI_491]